VEVELVEQPVDLRKRARPRKRPAKPRRETLLGGTVLVGHARDDSTRANLIRRGLDE
jgi:hypothetical protein